MQSDMNVDL